MVETGAPYILSDVEQRAAVTPSLERSVSAGSAVAAQSSEVTETEARQQSWCSSEDTPGVRMIWL